ncbi:hypothetical protein [Nocardioides terrigena]|uniref:hypothetical protein n=1 Tax=Nocardioides terrigena TaxID=424797 RepID=UPI000D2FDD9D|nr:hypothetical protein [Nocardioides terrigena]
MRSIIIALLLAVTLATPAVALEAGSGRSVHEDADDDVRVVPFDEDDATRVGEASGDIRRVTARVGRKLVRVAVTFDAEYPGTRLELRVNFAARNVSGGRGHIAQLAGSFATGRPERSFSSFYAGDVGPELARCSGFQTRIEQRRWIFSVPTNCLKQRRRVAYQEISVQSKFLFDDAYGYDTWPRLGAAKIR